MSDTVTQEVWSQRVELERLGRPSRKAAQAAVSAHFKVLEGQGLKPALREVLGAAEQLGGQERRFVALAVRELSRHRRLLDALAKFVGQPPGKWLRAEDQAIARYTLWRTHLGHGGAERALMEMRLPGPVRPRTVSDAVLEAMATASIEGFEVTGDPVERAATLCSFPNWLAKRLAALLPEAELPALFGALNREPDLILRARPPGTRDVVRAQLAAEELAVEPLGLLPDALVQRGSGARIFESAAMKSGRLQVQDLGSQLICALCEPDGGFAGKKILDLCAGAGGKTLTLADQVGPSGQLIAADRSRRRLDDARQRAQKLGLRNVSFPKDPALGACDVVLIDAPCSGVGSFAREPDLKWRTTEASVQKLCVTQRELLEKVVAGARPGALIVYATCSLLRDENEAQIEQLRERHPSLLLEDAARWLPTEVCHQGYLRAWPHRVPGGGFFAARLRKPH
jgi:16S rRNA (cytosine967-C5)-methyltransferase